MATAATKTKPRPKGGDAPRNQAQAAAGLAPAKEEAKRDPRKLKAWPRNPNTHDAEQIEHIAKLMLAFGQTQRIVVDENDTILMGHGRTQAALKIGWNAVEVLVLRGLTDDQKRALVIADNQSAKRSEWDVDLLRLELGELKRVDFPLDLVGFGQDQLVSYLANPTGPTPPEQFQAFGENIATEHQCPKCGYKWSGNSSPAPDGGE